MRSAHENKDGSRNTRVMQPKWRVDRIYRSPDKVLLEVSMANYPFGVAAWPLEGEIIGPLPKNAD